jgi:hypothetical protein
VLDDASGNEYDIEIDPQPDASCELSFEEPSTAMRLAEFGYQDPLRSLSQVEQQIAAIDSDYELEAATGPQIDLSFEAAFDPFSESFAEEELVIDPFAMTATDALANRPIVQCTEGRDLAALLKPLPQRAAPKLSIAAPADALEFDAYDIEMDSPGGLAAAELSIAAEDPIVFHVSPENENDTVPAVAFWPQEFDASTPDNPRTPAYSTYRLVADSPPTSERTDRAHVDPYGEPDLIVIEDEPPGVHQVKVVRRGQYRRLFLSMRQS